MHERHELTIGIFMGGGSGLSSPRSMTLDLLEGGFELPITLV
jgi:phenol hydroxylase P5 protein